MSVVRPRLKIEEGTEDSWTRLLAKMQAEIDEELLRIYPDDLPPIRPDSNNPNPSPAIRQIMRAYNSLAPLARRRLFVAVLGLPRQMDEDDGPVAAVYNAMDKGERYNLYALFSRYKWRW
jgi:hypothetical protein